MTGHKIRSEVLSESHEKSKVLEEGNFLTPFHFRFPTYMTNSQSKPNEDLKYDKDGDLIINRNKTGVINIEHSPSTDLKLVGLQVWRGAFLLGDYIFSNPQIFKDKNVLELGSGVGLDTIVAGTLAKSIICTDIDIGGILKLIESNIERNKPIVKSEVCVTEIDFLNTNWPPDLQKKLDKVDVILAADVIYDDDITAGFVKTLEKLFSSKKRPIAYVALEKRFVFTIADLDSVAPMYEEFLRCIQRNNLNWKIEDIKIDFSQFFQYERLSQLILMKIEKKM